MACNVTQICYSNKVYNKLFTKILDSSVWLEADATRLVWITFIAIMDEDGFVALSAVGNVAARARVSTEDAEAAIKVLEAPDASDPAQDHEGRRIERVPYGWMVLNSKKYRDIIKRETAKMETRVRVAKFREKKKGVTHVTESNALVTPRNEKVTLSEALSETSTEKPLTPLPPLKPENIEDRKKLLAEQTRKLVAKQQVKP